MTDTALQKEVREMTLRIGNEREEALTKLNHRDDRRDCREAYYFKFKAELDVIKQRYNLPSETYAKNS